MRRHGFAVDDEGLKEQIEEWAPIGGGQFFDAAGSDELGDAIAAALQPPFEVRATAGAVIGRGVVDGDVARMPPSTYTVEVRSDPPQDFPDIVVGNGEELVLSLSDMGGTSRPGSVSVMATTAFGGRRAALIFRSRCHRSRRRSDAGRAGRR